MTTVKRVLKEYAQFEKEPLDNVWIQTDESNVLRCVCYFKMSEQIHIPMVVIFDQSYPLKAPDVGFPIDFGYNIGASYVKSDGPLTGMLVICLDILGNFAHVHNEWAGVKGSGWSPSYTLTSLLVNMQTVIVEAFEGKTPDQLDKIALQWKQYMEKNQIQIPNSKSTESNLKSDLDLSKISDQDVVQAIKLLNSKYGQTIKSELDLIISKLSTNSEQEPIKKIDPEIFCWFTSENYTENILGYGIQVTSNGKMKFLSTDGNYISWKAYSELRLRQYPTKEKFDYWLPAWICPSHSVDSPQWLEILNKSIVTIGKAIDINNLAEAIQRIYSDLINTMVVKIMDSRSDIRASGVVFKCLLNLWRTLICLVDSNPTLYEQIKKKITNFSSTTTRTYRDKSQTPNVGNILALSLALKPQDLKLEEFLVGFEDECHLRRVLWWQKESVKLDPNGTFVQSKISRCNVLFQILLRTVLSTIKLDDLDSSCCNLPSGPGSVESLLNQWRDIENRLTTNPTWIQYYTELKQMGFPENKFKEITSDIPKYIKNVIALAGERPGYTFSRKR
jgi:ubiquitin-protein ligase